MGAMARWQLFVFCIVTAFHSNGSNALCQHSNKRPQGVSLISRRQLAFVPFLAWPLASLAAEGTKMTPSTTGYRTGPRGLKYKIIQEGSGLAPQRAQTVGVTFNLYTDGFPEDGGQFLDSNGGYTVVQFRAGCGQVIKGWDLEVLEMKQGETRRIIVPPQLGFGARGMKKIPPNATLYYDLTLSEVAPPEKLDDDQIQWLEKHPL